MSIDTLCFAFPFYIVFPAFIVSIITIFALRTPGYMLTLAVAVIAFLALLITHYFLNPDWLSWIMFILFCYSFAYASFVALWEKCPKWKIIAIFGIILTTTAFILNGAWAIGAKTFCSIDVSSHQHWVKLLGFSHVPSILFWLLPVIIFHLVLMAILLAAKINPALTKLKVTEILIILINIGLGFFMESTMSIMVPLFLASIIILIVLLISGKLMEIDQPEHTK